MKCTAQQAAAINDVLRNAARTDFNTRYTAMVENVRHTLATNPHNTFKGTAEDYINKYGLEEQLRKEVKRFYSVNTF